MTKKKLNIPKIHPSLHLAAASLLFIISVIASRQAQLLGWEESLFLWIYDWPEFLRPFFIVITWLGQVEVLAALLIVFVIQKKPQRTLRLLMTSTLAYLLAGIGKSIWGRTRPNELLSDVVARSSSYGPGFPSGHTALAVAMALVVGHYLPKKYHWVVAVWIIGVALSRVYLGIHAPLDIVGGFAIGWFSYMLFRHVRLYPVRFGSRKKTSKIAYTKRSEKNTKKRTTK